MVVYKITNKLNGKIYIGITIRGIEERVKNHRNANDKTKFHNAIKKYGWENFNYEIVYKANTIQELYLKEIELIEFYNSYKTGYNSTTGGEISPMLIEENKTKLSQTLKAKLKTKEQKLKQVERLHKFIELNGNPRLGIKHTKETKQLLSELRMGKKLSNETKHKIIVSSKKRQAIGLVKDNEIQKTFLSIREASRELNISRGRIVTLLKNKTKYNEYTLVYL